jgi:hypothetical protein
VTSKRSGGVIDRDPQNLPVPLGGMAPVRSMPNRRHRRLRVHEAAVLSALGATAAVVGLILLLIPSPVAVSLFGDRVDVGAMVLKEAGSGPGVWRYEGEASYVLAEHADGSASAAAAWMSSGSRSSGVCALRRAGTRLLDECAFTSSGGRLTSVDLLDPATGSVWLRTYADGTRVTIAVSPDGGAVPVPFPIGR